MPKNYIPRKDNDFNLFQLFLMQSVKKHLAEWNISQEEYERMAALQNTFTELFKKGGPGAKVTRTTVDIHKKTKARTAYEKELRLFIAQWLRFNPKVTSSQKVGMALTVPDTTKTRARVPDTFVDFLIEIAAPRHHKITFRQQSGEEGTSRRAKPKGTVACEIRIKVGEPPPKNHQDFQQVEIFTRSPAHIYFTPEEQGKRAYYRACWHNSRHERGSWGEVKSAIIP